MKMKVKVKKLNTLAKIDSPAYLGDAGFDVYSTMDLTLKPLQRANIPLGVALEFDYEYVCLVQGKSGISKRCGLDTIGNVIDSSYRGEIHAQVVNVSNEDVEIKKGTKIAQLLFLPVEVPELEFVDNLSTTDRGEQGFGSTGV